MPDHPQGLAWAALAGVLGICCGLPVLGALGLLGLVTGLSLVGWTLMGVMAAAAALGLWLLVWGRHRAQSIDRAHLADTGRRATSSPNDRPTRGTHP